MASGAALPHKQGRTFLRRSMSLGKLFPGWADRNIPRADFLRRRSSTYPIGRRLCPANLANREDGCCEQKPRRDHCEHSHRWRLSRVEPCCRPRARAPCPQVHSNIWRPPLALVEPCPVHPYNATSVRILFHPISSGNRIAHAPSDRRVSEARPRSSSRHRRWIFPLLGPHPHQTTPTP